MIVEYSYGPYNKSNDYEQWIRISEGCPNNCPYCYEPQDMKIFDVPEIVRNDVKIIDMNLLCKPEALEIIKRLGLVRVKGRVVNYELICGIDWRFLTSDLAHALHNSRFRKIRMAWDYGFSHQLRIKDAVMMLRSAGYKRPSDVMIFMVCNWETNYETNVRKLDLLKVWRCQVSDCWFDNQVPPNIQPVYWSRSHIKDFRSRCRKHNHLVTFGIDPEYKACNDDQILINLTENREDRQI